MKLDRNFMVESIYDPSARGKSKIDPRLIDRLPKSMSDFKVEVTTYNGNVVDITRAITEISLYESIYAPFLYGEVIVVDNSAMLSILPFIGQEKITIQWSRDGDRIERGFWVTSVFDIQPVLENTGTYGLRITSEKQIRNATSLFSRAYSGRGDEIIKRVYDDFLDSDLEIMIPSKDSYNIVFPYIKPLQAIDMVTQNALAEDQTPYYLFENLYEDRPRLDSLGRMFEQESIMDIDPTNTVNQSGDTGEGQRQAYENRGQIYEHMLPRTFDTLGRISEGAYAGFSTVIDSARKEAFVTDFDFWEHAPPVAKNFISEFFALDQVRFNSQYDTKNVVIPQNRDAFENSLPNINGVDELDKMILRSYRERIDTSTVTLYMDSMRLPQGSDETFTVGKTVKYNLPRFSPKFNESEDNEDKVNSGKYIISAIRHYIKNGEYTMTVELIRDGMGDRANLKPNKDEPDLGDPPRFREDIEFSAR